MMGSCSSSALCNNNNNSTTKTPQSTTTTTETHDCIVCWEPISWSVPLACGHGACRPCIQSWIERCEQDGQDHATCPHCRQILDTVSILGRSYQAAAKNHTAHTTTDDSFTQAWLQENNAHQCSNCGVWMVQEEDGDDYDDPIPTACVCGYIYCWSCKDGAEDCECGHFEFWDPLTEMTLCMEDASHFPVAGPEQLVEESSLNEFMERRREAIHDFNERGDDEDDEDDDDGDEEESAQEEEAGANPVPLSEDSSATEIQPS